MIMMTIITIIVTVVNGRNFRVHLDPSRSLIIACDGSDYGIGAVLSHLVDENQERPIAYFSRSLIAAEKHCSQLSLK